MLSFGGSWDGSLPPVYERPSGKCVSLFHAAQSWVLLWQVYLPSTPSNKWWAIQRVEKARSEVRTHKSALGSGLTVVSTVEDSLEDGTGEPLLTPRDASSNPLETCALRVRSRWANTCARICSSCHFGMWHAASEAVWLHSRRLRRWSKPW